MKMRKIWKKAVMVLVCLLVLQAPAMHLTAPVTAAAASKVKSGPVRENGKLYYYKNGKKVKSKWVTINGKNGQPYKYYFSSSGAALMGTKSSPLLKMVCGKYYAFNWVGRRITNVWKKFKGGDGKYYYYYFGSDGAAYTGSRDKDTRELNLAVKKIDGKTYGFGSVARRLSGTYVKGNKFYYFNSSDGVYNASVTNRLRVAALQGKPASELKTLLAQYAGGIRKEQVFDGSCYGDGEDVIWYYKYFMVSVFRPKNGPDIVMGIATR